MPSLSDGEANALLGQLDGWTISAGPRLGKTWKFPDFATALAFVNRIGAIADAEDHHPDVALSWGRVGVELWSHAAGGLTENDFIVAAKIDEAKAAG
jgi:4a-hydroxytetrahydrobiopterin dehydratase